MLLFGTVYIKSLECRPPVILDCKLKKDNYLKGNWSLLSILSEAILQTTSSNCHAPVSPNRRSNSWDRVMLMVSQDATFYHSLPGKISDRLCLTSLNSLTLATQPKYGWLLFERTQSHKGKQHSSVGFHSKNCWTACQHYLGFMTYLMKEMETVFQITSRYIVSFQALLGKYGIKSC